MTGGVSTGVDGLTVRFAQRGDVATILRFIRELAAYEGLADQVVADEDGLAEALFGPVPEAEAFVADLRGEPIGFALFYRTFSTILGRASMHLEDLYVDAAHRGQGVGRALLGCLSALAYERGCGRLEWAVLDGNEAAVAFYERLGARAVDDLRIFRIAGEGVSELAARFGGRVPSNRPVAPAEP